MNILLMIIVGILLFPIGMLILSAALSVLLMGGEIVLAVMETLGLTFLFLGLLLVIGYMLQAIKNA